ncbi:Protein kinase C-like phorbol ester/diacylglycerol-binding domain [Arabidopsis thaliana x Arabidopsis arenosa]|uniref:Protein kinase C-like phorbol ester/diacylglycerol-binding domain n=1 Tax=Arabidopsis thaliana x Arabidopsis arenosa TaxID=1240361 RepID=A0A8T1XIY9_9BRAS|nr:Protein kinase C-like phorbol ester/diacylglycerol-binding domain [Arabidopsis thaliana x Arabidopsis arenosa]
MSSTDVEVVTFRSFPFHDHPLSCCDVAGAADFHCSLCSYPSISMWRISSNINYHCKECDISMHKECVDRLLNQPFICNHILKIFFSNSEVEDCCHFCRFELKHRFARCTICNINLDIGCVAEPPPLTISETKHHKHSLTLLLRLVTFTCNACGVEDDRNPYVCLECNLMVHKDCIENLPRVISINRHDHRISHTFHLGEREGDWECGVCRKTINWVYGGYKCSHCPSYAVHSRCATREEVWDGLELEDVPEEEEIIEDPFKVINEKGDIVHFSHEEHILRLDENYVTDDAHMRCRCCILAINGDPCYRCVECDFILHEACANLPRKKRHLLHKHKLTLSSTTPIDEDGNLQYLQCGACEIYTDGFMYECLHEDCESNTIQYDVRCSSVSEPFHHDLHQHPLYFTLQSYRRCQACNKEIDQDPLNCTVCDDYSLCMRCATLPRKVKHRCDDHFLSLCQGVGNASGDLWCDICETKTDPSVCYYTCDECGLSLHIDCVLGDLYYIKVGHELEVHPNNGATRPLCAFCRVRCRFPFFMTGTKEHYACSLRLCPNY